MIPHWAGYPEPEQVEISVPVSVVVDYAGPARDTTGAINYTPPQPGEGKRYPLTLGDHHLGTWVIDTIASRGRYGRPTEWVATLRKVDET